MSGGAHLYPKQFMLNQPSNQDGFIMDPKTLTYRQAYKSHKQGKEVFGFEKTEYPVKMSKGMLVSAEHKMGGSTGMNELSVGGKKTDEQLRSMLRWTNIFHG